MACEKDSKNIPKGYSQLNFIQLHWNDPKLGWFICKRNQWLSNFTLDLNHTLFLYLCSINVCVEGAQQQLCHKEWITCPTLSFWKKFQLDNVIEKLLSRYCSSFFLSTIVDLHFFHEIYKSTFHFRQMFLPGLSIIMGDFQKVTQGSSVQLQYSIEANLERKCHDTM